MSIPAIGGVSMPSLVTGLTPSLGTLDAAGASGAAGTASAGGTSFADVLGKGLENLNQTQAKADELGVQAATGDLTDVHDYVIASTQAQLTTELTVTLRNKALEAFNEIMRMQG